MKKLLVCLVLCSLPAAAQHGNGVSSAGAGGLRGTGVTSAGAGGLRSTGVTSAGAAGLRGTHLSSAGAGSLHGTRGSSSGGKLRAQRSKGKSSHAGLGHINPDTTGNKMMLSR